MSFTEQEHALLDLLFNTELREAFCQHGSAALEKYGLSADERNDFDTIRPDALQMDADMRANLILAHLSKHLPLSFSLMSSVPDGLQRLRNTLTGHLMQNRPYERPALFANALQSQFALSDFNTQQEYDNVIAIIQAETGLSVTAAQLKQSLLEDQAPVMQLPEIDRQWVEKNINLAPNCSLAVIPQPYQILKKHFCPRAGSELWQHLKNHPLPASVRSQALEDYNPRLMIARARVCEPSDCDPGIDHFTAELAEGFAPIFQHINGHMSVNALLAQLQHAGANHGLLQSVQTGLLQLLESGFLVLGK